METSTYDLERMVARRPGVMSGIRWGAVFAGIVAGFGLYLLLTLFGAAAGLSVVGPQAAQMGEGVSIWAAIWGVVSMLAAAFVGGWVAARMSLLRRRIDGMLHGFVTWGLTTLIFAFFVTTAAGILGGALDLQGIQQGAQGQIIGIATAASWFLFASMLLSLILAIIGGALGARGTSNRAIGDHRDERYHVEA